MKDSSADPGIFLPRWNGGQPQMAQDAFSVLLELALWEDLGAKGDITSRAIFGQESCEARIVSRSNQRVFGLECGRRVFERIDSGSKFEGLVRDGADVVPGERVATIRGKVVSLLQSERIALNFMGYLSGIATRTREISRVFQGFPACTLLDTRKTLPGYRSLAKAAVLAGGGHNHRMGLYDMVLIKDNHVDAAGGISKAVERCRKAYGSEFRIEVECRNLDEVREALGAGVDVVMLDNMDEVGASRAISLRNSDFASSRTVFEASGDMDAEKILRFLPSGVELISMGALTHSVSNGNFSMQIELGTP